MFVAASFFASATIYICYRIQRTVSLFPFPLIYSKITQSFSQLLVRWQKKLFSALNFPRTSSGTMQRNNYLPRSNPRTKKGGTRFHICMLQGNASLILIPRRMLIRLPATSVCEQTGCAKIDAAMNLTKDTSLANHLSHFFLYFFLIFHC